MLFKRSKVKVSRRRQLGTASLQRCEEIRKNYQPLHAEVYQLKEEFLAPEFLSLVSASEADGATVESLLQRIESLGDEVYRFPVFTDRFCQLFVEELESIERSSCPKERPNTMNKFGVLLNEFGFNKGLLDPLRLLYLTPITSLLFPDWGGGCLDSHKAFTVTYDLQHDLDLSCHFDNAEVTLNVALTQNFTGGDLYFLGMHGEEEKRVAMTKKKKDEEKDDDEVKETMSLKCLHRPNWGVLHRGRHFHGAEPLTSGRRSNLIIWMRSSSVRNALCPMCGSAPSLIHVEGLDDGFRGAGDEQNPPVVNVCSTL